MLLCNYRVHKNRTKTASTVQSDVSIIEKEEKQKIMMEKLFFRIEFEASLLRRELCTFSRRLKIRKLLTQIGDRSLTQNKNLKLIFKFNLRLKNINF